MSPYEVGTFFTGSSQKAQKAHKHSRHSASRMFPKLRRGSTHTAWSISPSMAYTIKLNFNAFRSSILISHSLHFEIGAAEEEAGA